MKRVVIGTAGHVDHGKTSLVRAITGVDCDRLKEEKERGLTIELGFASLALPSGERVGVVDVPGHVRFIRHMLSGASGIDLVLLVIAADEGVMPQTREHVQICELLGIERGVVALTKKDLVDDDLLELARADVRDFLAGTFLRDAPIVSVSSVTGEGLDALLSTVEGQVALVHERRTTGIPVLPIDRVFTIRGFGAVVTGTLARGALEPGMDVEILPAGKTARIRAIQVHEAEVSRAEGGMRTAVNLQGVDAREIERGQWLAPAGSFEPTRMLDARLTLVARLPRGGVRMYIGTAEVPGDISLHETGGVTGARLRLKRDIVCACGDRFILRAASRPLTVAGGVVLNPHPSRRFSEEVFADLLDDDPSRRIAGLAKDAGLHGMSRRRVEAVFASDPRLALKALETLMSRGTVVKFDAVAESFVHHRYLERLREILAANVDAYHASNPSSPGIPREHLRSSVAGGVDAKLFHRVLTDLIRKGALTESGPLVARAGFTPSLEQGRSGLAEKMAALVEEAGYEPPRVAELAGALGVAESEARRILGFLCTQGRLVRISDDIHIAAGREEELKTRVRDHIAKQGSLTPVDMKAIVGVSRKFAIPYLEYLDRIHFTMRIGDVRKLAT